jgi:FtsH-binding integral membrane protein
MQKIKKIGESGISGESAKKATILGALSLYLDFINLFLFMLRIFGSAR